MLSESPSSQHSQPGSPSSSGTDASSQRSVDDLFTRHKVNKQDTLAGLAVRYKASVSDIRRANGLLSDNFIHARDTLLIPKQPLPVGPELSTWVGMLVTHYGRLGIGGESGLVPTTGPGGLSPRPTTSIQQLRGYYSTGNSRADTPGYESDADDRHHLVAGISGRRSSTWHHSGSGAAGREVELQAMSRSGGAAAVSAAGGGAASYADERVRRRRAGESGDAEAGGGYGEIEPLQAAGSGPPLPSPARPALFATQTAPSSARGAGPSGGGSTWTGTLLERMKRVASQPALRSIASAVAPPPAVAPHAASTGRLSGLSGGGGSEATPLAPRQPGGGSSSSGAGLTHRSVGKKAD